MVWTIITSGLVIRHRGKVYVLADGESRKFSWINGKYAIICDLNEKAYIGELEDLVKSFLRDMYDIAYKNKKRLEREIRRKDSEKLRQLLKEERERLETIQKILKAIEEGKARIELWTARQIQNASRKGVAVFL